jgi:hypothetical protein
VLQLGEKQVISAPWLVQARGFTCLPLGKQYETLQLKLVMDLESLHNVRSGVVVLIREHPTRLRHHMNSPLRPSECKAKHGRTLQVKNRAIAIHTLGVATQVPRDLEGNQLQLPSVCHHHQNLTKLGHAPSHLEEIPTIHDPGT